MIKFFRKIRQRLLSEHKFSKYLLYAIGEVVLVVIGILIALSLNNSNENKKLKTQEIKILKEIKSEFTGTLEDVSEDLAGYEKNLRSSEIIYNSILNKESYNDSLKRHFSYMLIKEEFLAKQSAFESLKSIGLEIISNDSIRKDITDAYLYVQQETNKPNIVTETIIELDVLLKPHIVVDRQRLILDEEDSWIWRSEIPFKFINYQHFLEDDKFLYALMKSLKMRNLQIYIYGRYKSGLEYYLELIEKEIKSLEKK
ncbi:MAG: DUF6090 family protein [Bacteroidetes bacterium]|jgi:hypothetical protein|nr:DUF6090 family protein [Bacteroidota bacterium]